MPISLIRQHPHVPVFHTIILITVSLIVRFVHHSALIAILAALTVFHAITLVKCAITIFLTALVIMAISMPTSHCVNVKHKLQKIFF